MDNDEVGTEGVRASNELTLLAGEDAEANLVNSTGTNVIVEEEAGDAVSDTLSVASEELEVNIADKLDLCPAGVTLSTEQKLAWWMAFLPTVKADVVEELGGNDLCWISAESLILRLTAGEEYKAQFITSPRFLELTYEIERFLSRLREVGVVFELIFFDCFKSLLISHNAALWAFRECFRLHCASNPDAIPHKVFDNWFDEATYGQAVTTNAPFVLIVEDGSGLTEASSIFKNMQEEKEDDNDLSDSVTLPGEHGYATIYSLMLNTVGRQINVALLYKILISGRRVLAFCVGPESYVQSLEEDTMSDVLRIADDFTKTVDTTVSAVWSADELKNDQSFRRQLLTKVAAEILIDEDFEGDKNEVGSWSLLFMKSVMLHHYILDRVSIDDRASTATSLAMIDDYTTALEFLFANVQQMIRSLPVETLLNLVKQGDDLTLADVFDEMVLREALVSIFEAFRNGIKKVQPDHFGFDQDVVRSLEDDWKNSISTNTSTYRSFFPIELGFLEEEGDSILEYLPENLFIAQSSEADSIPKLLPIESNDFMNQMIGQMDAVIPGVMQNEMIPSDGVSIQEAFLTAENSIMLRPIAIEEGTQGQRFGPQSAMDVARSLLDMTQNNRAEIAKPKRFARLSGAELLRAIRRWEQRKLQEARVFARDINKHFGFLDQLHLPIILIGGKAQNTHPWILKMVSEENAPTPSNALTSGSTPAKKTSKKGSDTKAVTQAPKMSSKAAAIIAKNEELKAEKKRNKEEDVTEQLYASMNHVFKKKVSSPSVFNDELRELLVGARTANDATIIEDFAAVTKILTLEENQIGFLTALALKIADVMEHTFRLKLVLGQNQLHSMLNTISIVFRFVHVTVEKLHHVMSSQHIQAFQTLLLMMGFKRSSRAVFEFWARYRMKEKFAPESTGPTTQAPSASSAPVSKKKGGNDTSSKKTSKKSGPPSEKETASYFKKLESEAFVSKTSRSFDLMIRPEMEATFQLKYMGADMSRTLGSIKDPRVTFMPDAWQKRLLDVVDAQQSCLVVAPTASGKTYACYYAMDQVLRFDNESCVIFISPARALALQVQQEVIARFSKKAYPAGCPTVLHGHLFEDRWENWNNSQILITVPSAISVILSSTDPAIKQWQKKVKYAILDEIHCIGESSTEREYENLIQMLPCPFMALSATVGNESDFSTWLSKAQSFPNARPVKFIKHSERYADLQTWYYSTGNQSLYNVNPLACLNYERLRMSFNPADFSLIPTDLLTAFHSLIEILKSKIASPDSSPHVKTRLEWIIAEFNPEIYFQGCRAITKKQYRRFSATVLHLIRDLSQENIITEKDFDDILSGLMDTPPVGKDSLEPWWPNATKQDGTSPTNAQHQAHSEVSRLGQIIDGRGKEGSESTSSVFNDPCALLTLIRELESRKLMPALVFNFSRSTASRLFYKVLHYLVDEHYKRFYGTPEAATKTRALNKKRQDDYKADLARREVAEKWKTLSKEQRELQGIDESTLAELTGPPPPAPVDVAEEHDPDFYLCDKRIYLSLKDDFNDILNFCRIEYLSKSGRIAPILVEGLKRGIGLYHDALHREYRRAVEFLFRKRYLRVVLSDSSLSLGVNMPCKTTVFAGDSPILTPLLYRQTSGRAGRRGFDSLGHVLFWEFPFKKIKRLLCSKLATLSGAYPVRPTTVLKAMTLAQDLESEYVADFHKHTKDAPVEELEQILINSIDRSRIKLRKVFMAPFYGIGACNRIHSILEDNTKISIRFAADLIRRFGFLAAKGTPGIFAPGVLAIPESEPGNMFVFYAILEGVLRAVKDKHATFLDDSIVQLVAFALHRREYTYSAVRRFELAAINPEVEQAIRGNAGLVTQTNVSGANEDSVRSRFFIESTKWTPLLPPLEDKTQSIAEEFDRIVFQNAVDRCKALALLKGDKEEEEYKLPLTGMNFSDSARNLPAFKKSEQLSKWSVNKNQLFFRHPFARGSDEIQTSEELIRNVRDNVLTEVAHVPQLCSSSALIRLPNTENDVRVPLVNSYILNILQFGSLRRLIECNDIPPSEAYRVVLDMQKTINLIKEAVVAQTIPVENVIATGEDTSSLILPALERLVDKCKKVHIKIRI